MQIVCESRAGVHIQSIQEAVCTSNQWLLSSLTNVYATGDRRKAASALARTPHQRRRMYSRPKHERSMTQMVGPRRMLESRFSTTTSSRRIVRPHRMEASEQRTASHKIQQSVQATLTLAIHCLDIVLKLDLRTTGRQRPRCTALRL